MPRQRDPEAEHHQPHLPSLTPHLSLTARLRAYLLAGIVVTAPIAITLYLAWLFINFIDHRVSAILPSRFNPETYMPFSVPGLGVLMVVAFLTFVGSMTAGFLGRLLLRTSERALAKMPLIRTVYSAVKQILETVLAQQSRAFREVVLVEYPRNGLWRLGFVTGTTAGQVQAVAGETVVNVFIPNTPNVTAGFLVFVPRRDVVTLNVTIEEGLKLVVSAGIVTPPDRSLVDAAPGGLAAEPPRPQAVGERQPVE